MYYGIGLALIIAFLSQQIHKSVGAIPLDAITLSLLLGIIYNILTPDRMQKHFARGITFTSKKILEFAIALMGFKLSLSYLNGLGYKVMIFALTMISVTILLSIILGNIFHLERKGAVLTGVGNAICGSSAIAAINPVWQASSVQMAMSIAVINFLGTVGMFLLPILTKIFHYSDTQSAYLIGGTLQAVGHVAAAGFALGDSVGDAAIVIKMFRVLMIAPMILIFSIIMSKGNANEKKSFSIPKLPLFIVFFLTASIITTEIGPHPYIKYITTSSKFLLGAAMFAIGTTIDLSTIKKEGGPILYTGATLFTTQIILAVLLIRLLQI